MICFTYATDLVAERDIVVILPLKRQEINASENVVC